MSADFDLEEKDDDKQLSSTALALQRSATSQLERENTHHLHLRLNSHLMELSMKAEEAVEAIGKGRWASSRDVRKAATRSRTFSTDINNDCCRVLLPDNPIRLAWDALVSCVIAVEACILPLCTAWDVTVSPGPPASNDASAVFLQWFSISTLIIWPLDIILDFNTGFYRMGHLRLKRSEIARRYLTTWFAFDVSMVILDIAACSTAYQGNGHSRVLRMLQAFRVCRIVKTSKISVILENLVTATGKYWLILAMTVGKVVLAIAAVTHILACIWKALGQSVSNSARESWLDLAGIRSLGLQPHVSHGQYSLHGNYTEVTIWCSYYRASRLHMQRLSMASAGFLAGRSSAMQIFVHGKRGTCHQQTSTFTPSPGSSSCQIHPFSNLTVHWNTTFACCSS